MRIIRIAGEKIIYTYRINRAVYQGVIMSITCSLSIGEFLDKVSILLIKIEKLKDEKKQNCQKELELLMPLLKDEFMPWLQKLVEINEQLFETIQKQHETIQSNTDDQFIQESKKVFKMNSVRYKVKDAINKKFESDIIEEKSY